MLSDRNMTILRLSECMTKNQMHKKRMENTHNKIDNALTNWSLL